MKKLEDEKCASITRVHVISKTHLDLGFTRLAAEVVSDYLDAFIPKVTSINDRLRQSGRRERLTWTLGSWMVAEYLERADSTGRRLMETAIELEDIVWHALPFTFQAEMMSTNLMRDALKISKRLDSTFGRTTIAAKLTDVPGQTRALVPLLAEAGVEFLHVGVNGGINMPQVPPMFVWADEDSGTAVTVLYHPDYGGFYAPPGSNHALDVEMTYDNEGPPSLQSVVNHLVRLSERFPDADVNASTLDQFAVAIRPILPTLPVVTHEIGDTWIHGIGTRPRLVRAYRETDRWLREQADLVERVPLVRRLIRIPEHTWGLDTIMLMPDGLPMYGADLFSAIGDGAFRSFEDSWGEQDDYLVNAIHTLADPPTFAGSQNLIADEEAQDVDFEQHGMAVSATGALVSCTDPESGMELVRGAIGSLTYQVYGAFAYSDYRAHYVRPEWQTEWWVSRAFGRPGLDEFPWRKREWLPEVLDVAEVRVGGRSGLRVQLQLSVDDERLSVSVPKTITVHYLRSNGSGDIEVRLRWADKAPTRLPEALWVGFDSPTADSRVSLSKLNSMVDAHATVLGGARRIHGVQDGIRWTPQSGPATEIVSLDTPLVSIGAPELLDVQAFPAESGASVHFNLFNNVWGTNFPLWIDGECEHRFIVRSRSNSGEGRG